jgi:hypothetical protein
MSGSFEETFKKFGLELTDPALATALDAADPLRHLRAEFNIPLKTDVLAKDQSKFCPYLPALDCIVFLNHA